jgi:dynein heavy chain
MNTVLTQEVIRYQGLIAVMIDTLMNLQKALIGRIVMSEELQNMANSLFDNQVPVVWADKGFLSLKPLASWFQDFKQRIEFLNNWIKNGTPKVFWISGFFFPQAFLTGTKQNYARAKRIAIDRITFKFHVLDDRTYEDITEKPEEGVYIYGLFLEGARWDKDQHSIAPSFPKELYVKFPLMHILPKEDLEVPKQGIYKCPVYKVLSRQGTLSTTGHSTNFVLKMIVPSKDDSSVWIKAGVALFLALRN